MEFLDWWATEGLKEYRSRCENFGVIGTDMHEAVAKHCAWNAWLQSSIIATKEFAQNVLRHFPQPDGEGHG